MKEQLAPFLPSVFGWVLLFSIRLFSYMDVTLDLIWWCGGGCKLHPSWKIFSAWGCYWAMAASCAGSRHLLGIISGLMLRLYIRFFLFVCSLGYCKYCPYLGWFSVALVPLVPYSRDGLLVCYDRCLGSPYQFFAG